MDTAQIISVVSAVAAVAAAIAAYINNKQAKESNRKSSKIAEGAIEIEISTAITQAKLHVQNTIMELMRLQGDEKFKEFCEKAIESSKEDYINQYDLACQKYLDGKLDKIRFEKSYKDILKKTLFHPNYKYLYDKDPMAYEATIKVVNMLHSKES